MKYSELSAICLFTTLGGAETEKGHKKSKANRANEAR